MDRSRNDDEENQGKKFMTMFYDFVKTKSDDRASGTKDRRWFPKSAKQRKTTRMWESAKHWELLSETLDHHNKVISAGFFKPDVPGCPEMLLTVNARIDL